MARAIYSRHQVVVLDDVFSGLDASSEERIFLRLLGSSGVLRKSGTTVVLATHAVHRLSYADHIIALDINGSICEQGTFDQIMAISGYISSMAARYMRQEKSVHKQDGNMFVWTEAATSDAVDAMVELQRPVGNVAVYKYYFDSVGYFWTSLFLIIMIFYVTIYLFQSKLTTTRWYGLYN